MFHGNEDGANAVEFALILPILVLLLFGAITFGLAFNHKLQVAHAGREAVRYAATLPTPGTTAWYTSVMDRAVRTSAGSAHPSDPSLTICVFVQWTNPTTNAVSTSRLTGTGAPGRTTSQMAATGASGTTPCYTDGLTGDRVQVRITRGAELSAVFFRRSITLVTEGVAVYEGS